MFDPALSARETRTDNEQSERHAGRSASGAGALRDTTMNITPLDLRQQRFRTAMRGFDKVEVASFMAAVADDYEQALRETDRLRQDLVRMEAALSEHREHEKNLKATLMTAQRLADDIKAHAEQEAARIVQEAQSRSDLLLEKTQARLEDIQREIDGLKLKRKDAETTIEATIQTLRNTLEFVRDQESHERDERLLIHRPKADPPAAISHQSPVSAPQTTAEAPKIASGG
jgi:cell division initiation protein